MATNPIIRTTSFPPVSRRRFTWCYLAAAPGVAALLLLSGCATPLAPPAPASPPAAYTHSGGNRGNATPRPVVRGQYPSTGSPQGYPLPGNAPLPNGAASSVPAAASAAPAGPAPPGGTGVPLAPVPPLPQPGLTPEPVNPALTAPQTADIDATVEETTTGRFNFGVGVNSDLGVTGQIVIDERNFDLFRLPRSWDELISGRAFRGAGQGLRIEAIPGTLVQRYSVSFTEPYLFSTPVTMSTSGFLFDRIYQDWMEQRLGGRLAFGYRLTPDLSTAVSIRAEEVKVYQPRISGVAALDEVLGDSSIYSGRVAITHDTRDFPFAPTEGHLLELSYEQVFGDFDYPRFEVDYRRYFLLKERADGSGRHTLGVILGGGISGSNTPLFENYFAGGFSTIRGFTFRGASPVDTGVIVGGRLRILGSVEYVFPLTQDDMIKGALFTDFGTVERDLNVRTDNFRVAPGFGLRVNVPALGPAPLAFDFAFPVARAATDDLRVFSFFVGVNR